MTAVLFVVAGVFAVGDWAAVRERFFRLEYLLKPLTMVVLVAAAAGADIAGDVKPWLLAGLVLGLLGDVAIMVSSEDNDKVDVAFVLGVLAFLAAHVCYLTAFARYGVDGVQLLAGALIVAVSATVTLPKVLVRANAIGGQELAAIIAVYALLLGAMAALAVGTASLMTAVGGVAFLASDALLSRDRFVRPMRAAPVLVAVTYHLAQFLIVLGLTR